ncbi:hypothetical protein FQZ97_1097240 [compost metagenome]
MVDHQRHFREALRQPGDFRQLAGIGPGVEAQAMLGEAGVAALEGRIDVQSRAPAPVVHAGVLMMRGHAADATEQRRGPAMFREHLVETGGGRVGGADDGAQARLVRAEG